MDVLELMKDRLKAAESDAEALRRAIAVLEQDSAPKPARRRRASAQAASKPDVRVVPLGTLLKLIEEKPGETTSAIARATAGEQSAILALLKEAEVDGKVRREGQRRATSWFVVTEPSDEEKIAARVAELEAQSKPRSKRSRKPSETKTEPTPDLMDGLETQDAA